MYKKILVATDGSPLSDKAVKSAIDLCALTGAELIAMKVIQRFHKSYFDGPVTAAPEEIAKVEAQWLARTKEIVDTVKVQAEKQGVKTKAMTVKSDLVSDAIIATAKKQNCDLIVMASHGRRGLKRLILGSETQHVLTHTEIPVLVLR